MKKTILKKNNLKLRYNKPIKLALASCLFSVVSFANVSKKTTKHFTNSAVLNAPSQQTKEITGTVTDDLEIPLPGVTISIVGKSVGVVTDFDGNYTINAQIGDVLQYTYIGYETIKLTVSNKSNLNVTLKQGVDQLDEVVITDGYKQIDRRQFAGVATKLKLDEVKVDGVSDPGRLLEGRASGVVVDNVSGSFGASPRIRIRGNTSINGNNNPIWVVDGVILEDNVELPQGALASGDVSSLVGSAIAGINPDDIESFSILKDASATALYGARAKNGVIVITTKKGKKGAVRINYSTNSSFRIRPRYNSFNVLNSQEELQVYKELVDKGNLDITTSQRAASFGVIGKYFTERRLNSAPIGANNALSDSFFNRYQEANTDWFGVLFNNLALQTNHSLSVSGGAENAQYYFSLGYLDDTGQTIGNSAKRYTAKLNTTFKLSEKLSLNASLNASIRDQKTPGTNDRTINVLTGQFRREFDINPYSYALSNSRSSTVYDENGNLEYFRRNYAPFNIIHELDNNFINIDVTDLTFQTGLDYKITNDFTVNTLFNLRRAITTREHLINDNSNQAEAFRQDQGVLANINPFLYQDRDNLTRPPYSVLPEGGINIYNQDILNYAYMRNSLTWNKRFNDIHEISALGGFEIKSTVRESRRYDGFGISYDNGYLVNTEPDIIDQQLDNNDQYFNIANFRDRFTGFFANAGYTYDNRYTFNGTIRRDGSNLQGSTRKARYLTSWNLSGAWNIDRENFFNINWVSLLKLKATYGLSGGRGPLASISRLNQSTPQTPEDGGPPQAGASLDLRGDVPLRPQDVESLIRISSLVNNDLTFEKLKEFSVGLEYSLFNDRIAGELGYYSRKSFDLIGFVRNSGVGGIAVKAGNFADLDVNGYEFAISTVNIKTDNFKWSTSLNIGYNTEEVKNISFEPRLVDLLRPQGHPYISKEISSLWSTKFAGLNELGIPTFFDVEGNRVTDIDLQSREDIEKVLTYEGPTQPRGAGGFTNTFNYKGFSLSGTVSFKFDYKIRLNSNFDASYNDLNSLPGELVNRWRLPGDENFTNIPAILDNRTAITALDGFVSGNGFAVIGDNAYDLYNLSSLRVVDGTYFRMRSISLGYKVPNTYTKRLGLTSAGIRFQAENLFLIYADEGLKGQDPEFFNSGGSALPVPKSITISLNVGF